MFQTDRLLVWSVGSVPQLPSSVLLDAQVLVNVAMPSAWRGVVKLPLPSKLTRMVVCSLGYSAEVWRWKTRRPVLGSRSPFNAPVVFQVTRAFFLLGVFQAQVPVSLPSGAARRKPPPSS